MQAWLPSAFLPVGPKQANKIRVYPVDMQEIQALQSVHDILEHILKPLSNTQCQQRYKIVCADGNVRLCFPKLFCSLANHMENATLHSIASNCYPACITPTEKLGEHVETGYPIHRHANYRAAYMESDMSSLNVHGVKNIRNALWSVPNLNPPDLIQADILHNMLLGVLYHMMDCIQGFLEQHDCMNVFDHV